MEKVKKKILISMIVIFCIGVSVVLELTAHDIEKHTWRLSAAQQAQSPCVVVAHDKDMEISDVRFFNSPSR